MKIRVIYKRDRAYIAGNSLDTVHYQSAKEYMKGIYEILKLELGKKYHSKRQVNVSKIFLADANAMAPLIVPAVLLASIPIVAKTKTLTLLYLAATGVISLQAYSYICEENKSAI